MARPSLLFLAIALAFLAHIFPTLATTSTLCHGLRSSRTCAPPVHGKLFQIQSVHDPMYFWTMQNCIEAACTRVILSTNSPSTANKWYAGTKETGSTPPFEISTASAPGKFCVHTGSKGGIVGGADCIKDEASQQFQFRCESCSTRTKWGTVFGTNCQAVSDDLEQCAQGHPLSEPLTLGRCNTTVSHQLFNLVVS